MKKLELIQKAADHLKAEGYSVIRTAPNKDIDILMFGKDKNLPIFVHVFDASKVKSIPMNGFGYSKKAKERQFHFTEAVKHWLACYAWGRDTVRCDAVYVNGDSISHGMNVNHIDDRRLSNESYLRMI